MSILKAIRRSLVLYLLLTLGLQAQIVWDNGGTGSGWNEGANWVGDTAPTSSSTTHVQFAGSSDSNVDVNNPWIINRLDFNAGYTGNNLSGNQIRFAGTSAQINDNADHWQSVNTNIEASVDVTISGTGSPGMGLTGVVSGSGDITADNLAYAEFSGTSANTFTGTFSVLENGYFGFNKTNGVNAVTSDIVLGSGSTSTGSLFLINGNQIPDSSTITMHLGSTAADGMILEMAGEDETVKGIITTGAGSGYARIQNDTTATTDSTLTINTAGSSYTFDGEIIDGHASATMNLVKTGDGTQTLGGVSTYTGTTTLSGGTLLLGDGGNLTGNTNLVLNGGVLQIADALSSDLTLNLGTLTLSESSVIDFGSNTNNRNIIISFDDSSGIAWTAGKTLRIFNWDGPGTQQSGVNTEIRFSGINDLTFDQRDQIVFYSDNGSSSHGISLAQFLATNSELVPGVVPEAGTYITPLLIGCSLFYLHRRRSKVRASNPSVLDETDR